ncbi:MAG: hypothetical protein U1F66_11745 [bacterium]
MTILLVQAQKTKAFLLSDRLTLIFGIACSPSGKVPDVDGSAENQETEQKPGAAGSGAVVQRIEKSGALSYKIYLQPEANGANRKGLILFGSGNDENDPGTGSLDGVLENSAANELAKLGYVAAIVAYRIPSSTRRKASS